MVKNRNKSINIIYLKNRSLLKTRFHCPLKVILTSIIR